MGHQRETPCGPEGRLEEVQFGGAVDLGHFAGNRQEFAESGAAKEEKEMRLVKAMVFKSREVVKGKT